MIKILNILTKNKYLLTQNKIIQNISIADFYQNTNLVLKVSNLNFQSKENDILEFINQKSEVQNHIYMLDRFQRFRGQMILQFKTKEDLNKVRQISEEFQGRKIKFEKFLNPQEMEKQINELDKKYKSSVLIKNIPLTENEETIKKNFESYGKINHLKFLKFKGTCIIFFEKEESSQKLLKETELKMNERILKAIQFEKKVKRHTVPQ